MTMTSGSNYLQTSSIIDKVGDGRMKPTYEEFCDAYLTIMQFIDTEPNSRKLFHALFEFKHIILKGEEE